ncbi:MAG: DUF1835 domain-containing protein, partial [Candidatus Thiodiazotropha sp. 6PLUC5]
MIQSLPELRRQFVAEQKSFHTLPADDPRNTTNYSLPQSKKQAKELLRSLRQGELWQRTQAHPNPQALNPQNIKLADAQAILAGELGFKSGSKFKHHVESTDIATKAINEGVASALDAQMHTLHIRCGTDVMYKLAVAGFEGDYLSFADPYIQGPVPAASDLDSFIEIRSDFIAGNEWRMREQARKELTSDYQSLERAREYERVAFWFEHDAYDVLAFIKLLHFFSDPAKQPGKIQFICIDHYPGVKRFHGIGQLPAQSMRLLWQQFKPVEARHLQFGKLCWEAYTASTPEDFSQLANLDDAPFPEIMPAIKRHIKELPWLEDGLSLSERLTLTILDVQGPQDGAKLFYHWYTTQYEPLVFMGDSSYWLVLDQLAQAHKPAIELIKSSPKPIDWRVSLTDFGRELLQGHTSWQAHNNYDRWFG